MKTRIALAALALSVAQMSYGAGTPTTHSCSDFKPTPEAAARFAELKGACESIVDINGRTFAKVTAIVRRATPNSVTLNIPATDNTFTLKPDPSRRVQIGNQKVRPADLARGQEIHIYIPTDTFAESNVTEVAMVEEPAEVVPATIETVPAEPEAALPTTASSLPTIALVGVALLFVGGVFRRMTRTV
jgi:hypothetical protein